MGILGEFIDDMKARLSPPVKEITDSAGRDRIFIRTDYMEKDQSKNGLEYQFDTTASFSAFTKRKGIEDSAVYVASKTSDTASIVFIQDVHMPRVLRSLLVLQINPKLGAFLGNFSQADLIKLLERSADILVDPDPRLIALTLRKFRVNTITNYESTQSNKGIFDEVSFIFKTEAGQDSVTIPRLWTLKTPYFRNQEEQEIKLNVVFDPPDPAKNKTAVFRVELWSRQDTFDEAMEKVIDGLQKSITAPIYRGSIVVD